MNYDDDSDVGWYLRDVARYPLLTAEEEVELALKIRAGKAPGVTLAAAALAEAVDPDSQDGHGDHSLSPAERLRLQQSVDVAKAARERMINSNLRLVLSLAKHYAGVRGAQFMDLVQEGNIGLIKAADRFDPDRGNRFSTFGVWWIGNAIRRTIAENSNGIRLPLHMMERYYKIVRVRQRLTQELGREPRLFEVVLELPFSEIKEDDRVRIREALQSGRKLTDEESLVMKKAAAEVQDLDTVAQDAISLTATVGPDDDNELIDVIKDDAALDAMDEAEKHILEEKVDDDLGQLDERERSVVELRYGFTDGQSRSLEEVAKLLNVSRERVRQLETRAINKLRYRKSLQMRS